MKMKNMLTGCLAVAMTAGAYALQVNVVKQGNVKVTVTLNVGGSQDYLKCLKKNLPL